MAEDRFRELKEKYVSVLNVLNHEHLKVERMQLENNKLFIRAHAPSEEAKNKFWNAVKAVNPKYADEIQADIQVEPQQAAKPAQHAPTAQAGGSAANPQQHPPTIPAGGNPATASNSQTYTVQKGDTLSEIAQKFYGKANEYPRIFEANRDQLKDPDKIYPGQVLKIPAENKGTAS